MFEDGWLFQGNDGFIWQLGLEDYDQGNWGSRWDSLVTSIASMNGALIDNSPDFVTGDQDRSNWSSELEEIIVIGRRLGFTVGDQFLDALSESHTWAQLEEANTWRTIWEGLRNSHPALRATAAAVGVAFAVADFVYTLENNLREDNITETHRVLGSGEIERFVVEQRGRQIVAGIEQQAGWDERGSEIPMIYVYDFDNDGRWDARTQFFSDGRIEIDVDGTGSWALHTPGRGG